MLKYGGYGRWRPKRRRKKKGVASQALVLAKSNKSRLAGVVELQHTGTVNSETAFNVTPIVDYYPAVGAGQKTQMKYLSIRGLIKRNVASDAIDDYRVDIILDRQPAGVKATVANIYGSANPELGDPLNVLHRTRYKLLRTMLGAFGESGNGVAARAINWKIPLNLIGTTKANGDFSQGNVLKNAVYIVYWTTSAANQPTMRCNGQIYCLDS